MAIEGFNHKIKWEEFRVVDATPEEMDFVLAKIEVYTEQFSYKLGQSDTGNFVASINVSIGIDKQLSWVLEGFQTDELLEHEQGHYDITSLGVRDLYNSILGLKGSRSAILRSAKNLEIKFQRQIDFFNQQYDLQTHNGLNSSKMKEWVQNIQAIKKTKQGHLSELDSVRFPIIGID